MLMDFATPGARRSHAQETRDAVLFIACYIALDWASSIYPLGPFNITPWNPPPALAIVWMLLGGLRYAPVVFVAILSGELLIHDAPGGVRLSIIASLILAGGFTAIAAVLRLRFQFDGRLNETRQLWIFIATTAVGAAIIGALYVGMIWFAGFRIEPSYLNGTFQFWLGNTVGVLVTAPLLMVAADPEGRQHVIDAWRKPETWLQIVILLGLIAFVFQPGTAPQQHFYLLFLPLTWIALRNGLGGAVLALATVQAGAVVGTQFGSLQGLSVVELQARVTALTVTGLALGIIVDERRRALEDLKHTLRLAAASEMASAIAHEINQPLSAMHNYGSACKILLRQGKDALHLTELDTTIDKMLKESRRASEVVRRLRGLFRRGTVQLEPVNVGVLLEHASQIGKELNRSGDVAFRLDSHDDMRTMLVDRIQIELILRNLIANAFEAVAGMPRGKKEITVVTRVLSGGRILFRITDSGEGLSHLARRRLFEPFSSNKSTGMGIGLAISRTIAEAHGGSLSAGDGEHGQFDLVLPIEAENE
jgi:two-component system, LuxR family, sensor kinase FixL